MFHAHKFGTGVLRHPGFNKKDATPPDYTPMANASKESAEIMARLGGQQLDFAKQQYNDMRPLLTGIADDQRAAQAEQMAQARDYWDYQKNTFRPMEQGMVRDAETFSTDAYREQLAAKAAADSGRAITATQNASNRAMASMGVNPNSGKFAGMQNANALGLAANRAGVMTGTRQQAEQLGWAKKMDAAGLGRGLSGASLGAYGGATNAGNSAGANYQAPGAGYMQGMGQGSNTIQQGRGLLQSGLGQILNTQGSVYGQALEAQGQFGGAVLGAGATLGAAAMAI